MTEFELSLSEYKINLQDICIYTILPTNYLSLEYCFPWCTAA